MKYYSTLFLLVFFVTCSAFSQGKAIKYTVSSGETVNQIAQKFKVTPFDIYELNPDARNGVKPNTVLLIPTGKSTDKKETAAKSTSSSKSTTHEVQPKETLYGIEKNMDLQTKP